MAGISTCLHGDGQVDGDTGSAKRITLDEILKVDGGEFQLDAETAFEDRASETEFGTGAKENSAVLDWR